MTESESSPTGERAAGGADCKRARRSISLRLDGELSKLGQLRLAQHLADCRACRRFASSLARLTEVVRQEAR